MKKSEMKLFGAVIVVALIAGLIGSFIGTNLTGNVISVANGYAGKVYSTSETDAKFKQLGPAAYWANLTDADYYNLKGLQNKSADTYILRVTRFMTSGNSTLVTIQLRKDGNWMDLARDVSVGKIIKLGNAQFEILSIDKLNKKVDLIAVNLRSYLVNGEKLSFDEDIDSFFIFGEISP